LPPSHLRYTECRRNGQGQASLLFGEQIGSDPVVVVEAQRLPSLLSSWSTPCSERASKPSAGLGGRPPSAVLPEAHPPYG
jgi:hypothetical protein